ncbi:hypothetical protein [Natrarchaeobius oligotrophus]|uniref:Small CPxCG-related zinc finger protein n=1 Tax=Natrarchaeobius chitinivorans TaxID=1679083 RepID=A0A3N6PF46_NATCH|nr:hypothetical protein [Natrarchaeobius chitinivorans]RQG96085.1 hypothetical protein EA472_20975 [Natrarchaeobius chitinivorans]
MATKLTIHCDCGTDVRTETDEGAVSCPDCESVFATAITELAADRDPSDLRHGLRSCRGP